MGLLAGLLSVVPTVAPMPAAALPPGAVPTQWIAKQYTELLGRAPTSGEWTFWVDRFQAAGATCDAPSLLEVTRHVIGAQTVPGAPVPSPSFDARYPEAPTLSEGADYDEDGIATTADAQDVAMYVKVVRAGRASALTRATMSSDPNDDAWSWWVRPYAVGTISWAAVQTQVLDTWFPALGVAAGACDVDGPGFGFHANAIDTLAKLDPAHPSRTQAELEAAIQLAAAAEPGIATVTLLPGEVIRIGGIANDDDQLQVLWTTHLRTATSPGPDRYQTMGRLIPQGRTCADALCDGVGVVSVQPASRLTNVWVDGQGADSSAEDLAVVQAEASGAWVNAVVSQNRITDPPRAGAAIRDNGFAVTGQACSYEVIADNLVTGYATAHELDRFGRDQAVDGVVVGCEQATVSGNVIVDVGGEGISVLGAANRAEAAKAVPAQPAQRSTISGNTIVSVGVDMSAAIAVDPVGRCQSFGSNDASTIVDLEAMPCVDVPGERSFAGTTISGNALWTGTRTRFDIGIDAGSRARWGDNAIEGRGPISFTGNTTGPTAVVGAGVAIAGLHQVSFTTNTFAFTLAPPAPGRTPAESCPSLAVGIGAAEQTTYSGGLAATVFPGTGPQIGGCRFPDAPRTDGDGDGHGDANALAGSGLLPITTTGDTLGYQVAPGAPAVAFIPWGGAWNAGGLTNRLPGPNDADWPTVVRDFREMRAIGYNTIRIIPELVDLVNGPAPLTRNETAFGKLDALVQLASRTGLYVDLTGLGIQTTWDDPAYSWFNDIPANQYQARWDAQAFFWREVATTLRDRSNIAFYDLMNEPINWPSAGSPPLQSWCFGDTAVLAGTCWNQPFLLTRAFSNNYFSTDPPPPGTPSPAQVWVDQMIDAIVAGDSTRPRVSLGAFVCDPSILPSGSLSGVDFLSIHVYPGTNIFGREALTRSADLVEQCKRPGIPLIVEETFNWGIWGGSALDGGRESPVEGFERFVIDSHWNDSTGAIAASGWISHYLDHGVPSPVAQGPSAASLRGYWRLGSSTSMLRSNGPEPAYKAPADLAFVGTSFTRSEEGAIADGDRAVRLNLLGANGNTVLAPEGGHASFQDVGNTFTFASWVKTSSASTQTLWGRSEQAGNAPVVRIMNDGDVQLTNSLLSVSVARADNTNVANGAWHHVVVVHDGTAATSTRIYIDGVEAATYAGRVAHTFADVTSNWWFGGTKVGTAVQNDLNGYLDEVAVFDEPLPATEIAAHRAWSLSAGGRRGVTSPQLQADIERLRPNLPAGWAGTPSDAWHVLVADDLAASDAPTVGNHDLCPPDGWTHVDPSDKGDIDLPMTAVFAEAWIRALSLDQNRVSSRRVWRVGADREPVEPPGTWVCD